MTRAILVAVACLLTVTPALAQDDGLPWTAGFAAQDCSEWNRDCNAGGNFFFSSNASGVPGCPSPPCMCSNLMDATENPNTYAEQAIGNYYSLPGAPNVAVDEIWVVYYSGVASGYNMPGDSQKQFIINYTDGTNSTRTYQIYVFWREDGTVVVDRADWTGGGTFTPINQNTNLPAFVWVPDQMTKFKLHVRNNTAGNSDGVVQLWINDVLKLDRSNININGSSGHSMGKLILSGYTNDATDTDGVQCWDSFTASATDPESGGGATAPARMRFRQASLDVASLSIAVALLVGRVIRSHRRRFVSHG